MIAPTGRETPVPMLFTHHFVQDDISGAGFGFAGGEVLDVALGEVADGFDGAVELGGCLEEGDGDDLAVAGADDDRQSQCRGRVPSRHPWVSP